MRSFNDIQTFIDVASCASISEAARQNAQTPAAVSAAIKRLEKDLGNVLFIRSTRSLRLSVAGDQFLSYAKDSLALLQQGVAAVQISAGQVNGTLQVSAPCDLGRNKLSLWLNEFLVQYPHIKLKLHLSDEVSDIYSQSIDIALRFGVPKDSQLIAIPLYLNNARVLVASPDYIAKHGLLTHPLNLADHTTITFMRFGEVFKEWRFYKSGAVQKVQLNCQHIVNDGEMVRRWAIEGKGIAYKSYLDVIETLASGELVHLCPDWQSDPLPLYMMYADRRQMTPVITAFRDFIQQKIAILVG
ncbi:LysR family transcriptional regulator [Pseudoalteromonas sp. NCIMB_1079]|uniref:LysR family transcriptional regulator n=1 Tax=Pseudoalteromonas sp. NCIMB 1079 TaxID=3142847 RepID=UPI00339BC679